MGSGKEDKQVVSSTNRLVFKATTKDKKSKSASPPTMNKLLDEYSDDTISSWSDRTSSELREREQQERHLPSSSSSSPIRNVQESSRHHHNHDHHHGGISIPSFLQPLFGIDFVPYLATATSQNHQQIRIDTKQQQSTVEQDLDDDLDVVFEAEVVPPSSAAIDDVWTNSDSDLLCRSHTELMESSLLQPSMSQEETKQMNLDHKPVDEDLSPNTGKTRTVRKRGVMLRTTLKQFVHDRRFIKERKRPDSTSSPIKGSTIGKTPFRSRLGTWHAGETSPAALASTIISTQSNESSINSKKENAVGQNSNTYVARGDVECLQWVHDQQQTLERHLCHLEQVQEKAQVVKERTMEIHDRVGTIKADILQLRQALKRSEEQLRWELKDLNRAHSELFLLEQAAIDAAEAVASTIHQMKLEATRLQQPQQTLPSTIPAPKRHAVDDLALPTNTYEIAANEVEPDLVLSGIDIQPPLRRRAQTEPSCSSSFMRIHDLELQRYDALDFISNSSQHESSSISSSSVASVTKPSENNFFFIDSDIANVLERLFELGYDVATDESGRFTPSRETERLLLTKLSKNAVIPAAENNRWPIRPWHVPNGSDVLIWTGGVSHSGFGSDWPVCKARGIVQTSPLELLDYLLDSSRIKDYNKISLGREDMLVIQDGVHTTATESPYGFAGLAKIMKNLNKPKLLPKTIEILSLIYAKPLLNAPGAYMTVSRSVFEDDSGQHKCTKHTIRSEMLLGVHLIRPIESLDGTKRCELTTITHIYTPGVPEVLAKRMAPTTAASMIRDIQGVFKK